MAPTSADTGHRPPKLKNANVTEKPVADEFLNSTATHPQSPALTDALATRKYRLSFPNGCSQDVNRLRLKLNVNATNLSLSRYARVPLVVFRTTRQDVTRDRKMRPSSAHLKLGRVGVFAKESRELRKETAACARLCGSNTAAEFTLHTRRMGMQGILSTVIDLRLSSSDPVEASSQPPSARALPDRAPSPLRRAARGRASFGSGRR